MLKDCDFALTYSTGLHREPKEFFTEALIESKFFDLGLGFFSTSGIRCLAYGFALFIANGGKMRVVINHILSEKDKEAIENGQMNLVDQFEVKILNNVEKLCSTLSREDEHFFRCFSYLISQKRIEFVATMSSQGGLGHDKYGVFSDENGDRVAFAGSANFSQTAMELNGESILAFTSWKDLDRVIELEQIFGETWNGDTPHLVHIPLDKVTTYIKNKYGEVKLSKLLEEGISLQDIEEIDSIGTIVSKPLPQRLVEKIEIKEHEPRFPFPEEREIQKEAYKAWLANNKKGIFAMATGSGKTVTALNCVLKQFKENGYYQVIIAVPTKALADQWLVECKRFNFTKVISTQNDRDWKNELSEYVTYSMIEPHDNLILITTYATFNRKTIQGFLNKVKGIGDFIFVADEAHNLGSTTSLKYLPYMVNNRIGLSATPERIYDDMGSSKVFEFFDSHPPKYTYRYTMKEAIDEGILCHYDYFPIFVELTQFEIDEYRRITDQLRKFIDPSTGKYKDDADKLLLKRKRIVHKATNKKEAIINLLDGLNDEEKLQYAFVFVPEGYEPDYGKSDTSAIQSDDIHIIDEYGDMFKEKGYRYHKYITGLDDAPGILKMFASGDLQVLLSMKCLDEGVDIPRAQYAIFCSSTGNPRQFVQRRGRVLRKCAEKEKAYIWDLVVIPPDLSQNSSPADKSLFRNEVKRIVNFANLADNKIDILYGKLSDICEELNISHLEMAEEDNKQYEQI